MQEGQLLAELDNSAAQTSFDAAQATLRQAQDAYDRMSKLHENGSISDIKFVEVETGLQQAPMSCPHPDPSKNERDILCQ